MATLFSVGETVTYSGPFVARPIRCTILKVMPIENDVRTYRVRDSAEAFERAVPESTLTKLAPSAEGRVFGR